MRDGRQRHGGCCVGACNDALEGCRRFLRGLVHTLPEVPIGTSGVPKARAYRPIFFAHAMCSAVGCDVRSYQNPTSHECTGKNFHVYHVINLSTLNKSTTSKQRGK